MTTVVATPGQGPDRPQEVSYTDIKVIGNGSFGVVYQARLIDSQEMVAIKKVLQDKRFKVCLDRGARIITAEQSAIVQMESALSTELVLVLVCVQMFIISLVNCTSAAIYTVVFSFIHHYRIGSCKL